jgi:hypothetical protein
MQALEKLKSYVPQCYLVAQNSKYIGTKIKLEYIYHLGHSVPDLNNHQLIDFPRTEHKPKLGTILKVHRDTYVSIIHDYLCLQQIGSTLFQAEDAKTIQTKSYRTFPRAAPTWRQTLGCQVGTSKLTHCKLPASAVRIVSLWCFHAA